MKHKDLISASSGGIPLGGNTSNSRFAAVAPPSDAASNAGATWGGDGDDSLSDIDLSDDAD